jgi:hypothetical protein
MRSKRSFMPRADLNYRTNNGALESFTVDGLNQLDFALNQYFGYDGNGNLTTVSFGGTTYPMATRTA